MEIRPDKLPLLSLVDRSCEGKILLPQFQRNFVWARDEIADLLLSILKGYFIGSFLFLEADKDHSPFAVRPLAGVNLDSKKTRPEWLVLDGQQRLTSLHYALAAPDIPLKYSKYPYRFFLDLEKVLTDDDEELIFSMRSDYCGKYLDRETQFEDWVLPLTEVSKWSNWKDQYEDWLYDNYKDEHQEYRDKRRPIWNKVLTDFINFFVPIIEIPKVRDDDPNGIAEVCAIFEKLNSTGVSLSVYDLLTARLYKYGIDLHSLWEQALEDNPQLEEFSGGEPDTYGIFILRTIALLRKQEVKGKTLINLSHNNFVSEWKKSVSAVEMALERLIAVNPDGFGVFDIRWQPYSTLVPGLAAMLETARTKRAKADTYKDIKCWYWGSIFLERYAGSVETITYRDTIDIFRKQDEADYRPVVFDDIKQNILNNINYSLRNVARLNSIYRGVMNLIAINGARDFKNNDAIAFHELEDHHIFPKAFLKKQYGLKGGDKVNTILNRTLLVNSTNRSISKKSPSQYLRDVVPDKYRDAILRSHLIGPEAQKAMERDDYDSFLEAREKDIVNLLNKYLEAAR